MDITSIERNLRIYGPPSLLVIIGLAGLLFVDPAAPIENPADQLLVPIKQVIYWGA